MEEANSSETTVNIYHISGDNYLHRISDLSEWNCFYIYLMFNLKVSLVKAVNNFSKQRERVSCCAFLDNLVEYLTTLSVTKQYSINLYETCPTEVDRIGGGVCFQTRYIVHVIERTKLSLCLFMETISWNTASALEKQINGGLTCSWMKTRCFSWLCCCFYAPIYIAFFLSAFKWLLSSVWPTISSLRVPNYDDFDKPPI